MNCFVLTGRSTYTSFKHSKDGLTSIALPANAKTHDAMCWQSSVSRSSQQLSNFAASVTWQHIGPASDKSKEPAGRAQGSSLFNSLVDATQRINQYLSRFGNARSVVESVIVEVVKV